MAQFNILTHEGEILRAVDRTLIGIDGVLCMRAYEANGTVINVAESRIVYGHEDAELLLSMKVNAICANVTVVLNRIRRSVTYQN